MGRPPVSSLPLQRASIKIKMTTMSDPESECHENCVGIFLYNMVYLVCGLVYTGAAIWLKSTINPYDVLLPYDNQFLLAGNLYLDLCITIGVLFILSCYFGFSGEKKCRLTRCLGATGRILIITLAIILIRSHPINREGIDEKITPEALSDSLRLYGAGNPNASTGLDMDVIASTKEAATVAWDEIQTTFNCCGIESYTDWEPMKLSPPVPLSCFHEDHRLPGCSDAFTFKDPNEASKIMYITGCLTPVRAAVSTQFKILGFLLVLILFHTSFGLVTISCFGLFGKEDQDAKRVPHSWQGGEC